MLENIPSEQNTLTIQSSLSAYINQNHTFLELNPAGVVILDRDQKIIYGNSAVFELSQLKSVGNINKLTFQQLFPFFRSISNIIAKCIEEGCSRELDKSIPILSTIDHLPVKIKIKPIQSDEEKTFIGALIIIETNVGRLVNFMVEEKELLSNQIKKMSHEII